MENEKKKPCHKDKVGRVRLSIWENETKNGTLYSATFDRVYKNKDGKFRSVSSFTYDDLELLGYALEKAKTHIKQQAA